MELLKTPEYDFYKESWQDFVHFRWLRELVKEVPRYLVDDVEMNVAEQLDRIAIDDTAKTGSKAYQTQLTFSQDTVHHQPGENQQTILRPFISDQLDFYWNKFTKPPLDRLADRCTQLESRATQLESRATQLENRATQLENRCGQLEGRSDKLEQDLTALKQSTEKRLGELEQRLQALENKGGN